MIFTRIKVSNFGVLKGPLELDFSPGLNVIHGPNESGKSTLVAALWAALTLRHRVGGNDRITLARVPRSGGHPEVKVDFTHADTRYEIEKRFSGASGRAHLKVTHADGRVEDLKDAEAEERLGAVLGLSRGADGKKDEDLGYLPLIWVRQEHSSLRPGADLNEGGRAALSNQLGRLQGELLGGPDADRLLAAAAAERDLYWTPTGQLRVSVDSPFSSPRRAQREAAALLHSLRARKEEHELLIDQQTRITADIAALDAQLPDLESKATELAARRAALDALRRQVETARQAAQLAQARAAEASRRWDARCDLRARLMTEKDGIERNNAELAAAAAAHLRARDERQAGKVAMQTAETEEARFGRQWQRADAWMELLRRQSELERGQERLTRTTELAREQAELSGRKAAIKVDDQGAKKIDEMERRTGVADAELAAASATVKITALADVGILVDERPFPLRAGVRIEENVSAPLTLRVSELVEIVVQPGGRDLAQLRQQAVDLRGALKLALEGAGVSSADEARQRAQERRDLDRRLDELGRELKRDAPDGSDGLRREVQKQTDEIRNRKSALTAYSRDDDPALPTTLPEAISLRAELEGRRAASRTKAQNAKDHDASLERALLSAQTAEVRATERKGESEGRIASLAADLARREHDEGKDEALKRASAEAGAARALADEQLAEQVARLAASNPEEVDAAAHKAAFDLHDARSKSQSLARSRAELQGRLGAADLVGLHDRLAESEARLEAAEDELRRLEAAAQAALHLYDSLTGARDRTRNRFLGPLRAETERLLRLVFPDASLAFDDSFNLTEINRAESDTFDVLSVGTREQLGVIVRLAMARVLAHDEPLPVILDDALVATDEGRFGRMIPVLQDAAGPLQILLLTCHWSRYQAVGEVADTVIDLAQIKRGPAR